MRQTVKIFLKEVIHMLLLLTILLVNSCYEQFLINKQELYMQMQSDLHSKMPNAAE